jgi:CubicO group peptidase (beta-lactamase class C family)
MFGILRKNGKVDLKWTMKDLDIDDIEKLTDEEKEATILDLLKSQSGIYHPSAYETDKMKEERPKRGSHKHGTFWYYNNWDFNVLCHIYNKLSESDFYVDLCDLGKKLGMQDLVIGDCQYTYDECSLYPAYDFRMSARDMAKFGLLFLDGGRDIITKDWIHMSTQQYAKMEDSYWPTSHYGLLWWVGDYGYGAYGFGGHMIAIVNDMVIVHRVDNDIDETNRVSGVELQKIVNKCVELYQ